MSRKTDLENALKALDGGAFQKLAESYVYRKLGLPSITTLGSQYGTNKVVTGIPDAHSFADSGIHLICFTTAQDASFTKLKKDISDALGVADEAGIGKESIAEVVCCHTCRRLTVAQENHLNSMLPNKVKLLGPQTIIEDLLDRYADLAFDHLGVPVGNGSILTVKNFIDLEDRRKYGTSHSKTLRNRDAEVATLVDLIGQNQLTVVSGQSGFGKTRIALEAVKKYGDTNHCESFVIEARSCKNAVEDINLYLRNEPAVVLVDDADQFADMQVLLQAMLSNAHLKVVMTVRDYAKKILLDQVRDSFTQVDFVIEPLSTEAIITILKEDYGIKNDAYLEQIMRISKGNLRLAIMAASRAILDNYPAIANGYDVLSLYFRGLGESLDEADIRCAEEFSLHVVSDLIDDDPAYKHLIAHGLTGPMILSCAKKLSELSILDLLKSEDGVIGIRFEQQNIRDFCVFRAMLDDRIISITQYIRETVLQEPESLVQTLNILCGVFGDSDTFEEVRNAAVQYWLSLSDADDKKRDNAMSLLHSFLDPYDLSYARNRVLHSPSGLIPRGDSYEKLVSGPPSTMMAILCETKATSRWDDAKDLLIQSLIQGGDKACSYKFAFESLLVPDNKSAQMDYLCENDLLTELCNLVLSDPTENACTSLMLLCRLYLQDSYTSVKPDDFPRKFTVNTWKLPLSESLARLHRSAINGLTLLLSCNGYHDDAIRELIKTITTRRNDSEIGRVDLQLLLDRMYSSSVEFAQEDRFLYELHSTCNRLGIMIDNTRVPSYSPSYALGRSVINHDERAKGFPTIKRATTEEVKSLVDYCCSNRGEEQLESHNLALCIDTAVYSLLDNYDDGQIIDCLEKIIRSGKGATLSLPTVSRAIDICGYQVIRNIVSKNGVLDLLPVIDGAIPDSDIDSLSVSSILEALTNSNNAILRAESVDRIDRIYPGFASSFWIAVQPIMQSKPQVTISFVFDACHLPESDSFFNRLTVNESASLKRLYLQFACNPRFDYDDKLLSYLWRKDQSILDGILATACSESMANKSVIIKRLGWLSRLHDNAFEELAKAAQMISEQTDIASWYLRELLSFHNEHLQEEFSVCSFVVYCVRNSDDPSLMIASFDLLFGDLPADDRFEIFSEVLADDDEGSLIKNLRLDPMSFFGSGDDGFIPQYQEEIKKLQELKEGLPHRSGFILHRGIIESTIERLKRELQQERWNIFHRRW